MRQRDAASSQLLREELSTLQAKASSHISMLEGQMMQRTDGMQQQLR